MTIRPIWAAALLATLVLVAGCKNGGHSQNSTDLRTLHAVIDAEPLDVLVTDDVKFAGVPLGTTTSFSEFGSGSLDVKIRSTTNGAVLAERTLALNSGAINTLVLYGKRGNIGTLLLAEGTTSVSSGKFRIRGVGLSPDSGPVDIYVTAGTVNDSTATIPSVTFGTPSAYSEFTPGSFKFIVTTAGTKEVLFQSAAQNLTDGQSITFGAFPSAGGKLVNGVMLVEGMSGSGTYMPNPVARVKVINAIPDSPALNFKADGTTLLSSVPFGGSSSYVTLTTGARTLQLEAANVPGTVIASKALTVAAATDYTQLALDTISAPRIAVLTDDNTFPAAGFAKVRFVNALQSAASTDVLVNFASAASGLGYGSASGYSQFSAATGYTISFASPGGVSLIGQLTGAELVTGVIYTVVLVGPANAPQVKLLRDR